MVSGGQVVSVRARGGDKPWPGDNGVVISLRTALASRDTLTTWVLHSDMYTYQA